MTDKSKSDDSEEPIDAEFETLQEADVEAPNAAAKAKKPLPLRTIGFAGIAALVVIIVLQFSGLNMGSVFGAKKSGDEARITTLSTQISTLESDVTRLKQSEENARKALLARLEALENKPEPAPLSVDDQVIADLQARIAVLETAEPAVASDQGALAALTQRLNQLEARLLAQKPDTAAAPLDDERLNTLEHRLAALENAPVLTASVGAVSPVITDRLATLTRDVAALEVRLLTLETQKTDNPRTSALALSLLALDSAAQSGAPFESEWRTLSQLLPQNTDVHMLAPLARTGIANRAALIRDFTKKLPAIRAAAGQDPAAKPGMMDKVKGAFGALVSVRRVDDKATGVDAVLARAETALGDDDLAGAIKALGDLDRSARAAAQGWLTQVQARLSFEQALARLKAITAEANP
ncbi:MAG: hypothetical protein COA85_01545 [Robiginitomaculum sp.]|nr:MAG: hypothetical protein COA85_01545 [Robiginitomaculum sp.]